MGNHDNTVSAKDILRVILSGAHIGEVSVINVPPKICLDFH